MSRFQVSLVVTRCLNLFCNELGTDANHAVAKEFHEHFHENNSEVRHDRGFRFVVCGSASVGAGAGRSGGGYSGWRRGIPPFLTTIEMDPEGKAGTKRRFARRGIKDGQTTLNKTRRR